MRWLFLVLRVALGLVFLYAAYTKLSQPWLVFALSIDAYQLLPEWAVLFTARTLPWFELVVGILLISGFFVRFAAVSSSALMLAFFAILVRAYITGMAIDCGCFGLGEALSPKTLVRDGLLALLAIAVTVFAFRRPKMSEPVLPAA